MQVSHFDFPKFKEKSKAKAALIQLLQNAHAGEKAAANAYWGHAHSLFITDSQEKSEILKIYNDELHHRYRIKIILSQLHAKPRPFREIGMWLIGSIIATLSFFGTWYIPMYGAGHLESSNIGEYEVAARLAFLAGEVSLVDELLSFGELEWDHEHYFRKKTLSHPLSQWLRLWPQPKPREEIRSSFLQFKNQVT